MSKHLYGQIVTAYGTAANNRGETEGNITTLQKLLWKGEVHTTVSAEAIRWAIRYYWQQTGEPVNRVWNDLAQDHEWQDEKWLAWTDPEGQGKDAPVYIDDDVMGFMLAEGAAEEGGKGTCNKRRGALEVTRAISLNPFAGDITFNARSGEKESTSLYGTEVHATRYQYGFALTPEHLRQPERVHDVLDAIVNLGEVAGNHSRFLFDFSPESAIYRWTDDFAPRLLYGFASTDGEAVTAPDIVRKVEAGDINAAQLYVGGPIAASDDGKALAERGAHVFDGVKAAASALKQAIGA